VKILKMTATFGRLEKAVLTPGEGLSIIEAPNEAGKSTWCAFLRAMLYGFPSRDRDKAGYVAEKNRYQPWSGAPMEGELELEWHGRSLTIRRGNKGRVAWGAFSAVWTATGDSVEGLTAVNCGETLLGLTREVFERTAFVGQGDIILSPSSDLEKRVAALAASGEEDVSYSQVERRLKNWLNRRKSNARTGLIPQLEERLAQTQQAQERQEGVLRQAQELRQERERLETERSQLDEQVRAHNAVRKLEQARRYAEAAAEVNAAQSVYAQAEEQARGLPAWEDLQDAQGLLRYVRVLEDDLRRARSALPGAREAAEAAQRQLEADALFRGMDAAQAAARAQSDHDEARRLLNRSPALRILLGLLLPAGLGAMAGALVGSALEGSAAISIVLVLAGAVLGTTLALLLLAGLNRRQTAGAAAILARYGAKTPEEILARGTAYAQAAEQAAQARQRADQVRQELEKAAGQYEEAFGLLLRFVQDFQPGIQDMAGIPEALSNAQRREEVLRAARTRRDTAQQVLSALPVVEGSLPAVPEIELQGDPGELEERLDAVNEQLRRVSDEASRLTGELESVGDPVQLSAERSALTEELDKRRVEYEAISAALDSLKAADALLRERFSPAVNAKTGEYFAALTGGKYDGAALTKEFRATARQAGESAARQALLLSGGAAQQLYLAARLAMCELALPAQEPCPIVLDDVLDAFDDDRARLAVRCLMQVAARRQVLLFSCHTRDEDLAEGVTLLRL